MRSETGWAEFGDFFCYFKMVAPRALVFRPLVKGNEALGTRLDQNKLCAHDKNRKRAELWVNISLFNVFVMYALDSAHEKVRRMKRSRSFAVVFDKPGR